MGVVVENDPTTASSRRTLPLDDGLAAVLRRESARHAEERLALCAGHRDSGHGACNEIGEPNTPDGLTRMWREMAKAAEVRQIRLHDARHSFGTAMQLSGGVAVIAQWLGHANPTITTEVYVHSQGDALNAAAKGWAAVVTSS